MYCYNYKVTFLFHNLYIIINLNPTIFIFFKFLCIKAFYNVTNVCGRKRRFLARREISIVAYYYTIRWSKFALKKFKVMVSQV